MQSQPAAAAPDSSGFLDQAGERIMEGDFAYFLPFLIQIVEVIAILLAFWIAYRVIVRILDRTLRKLKSVEEGVRQLALKSFKLTMLVFALITVLSQFINVAPLLAGLGVVGIAVGFAAQDTVQNFFSGITILVDKPFRVGDNISVDGTFGTVHEITLRSTRVRTLNNEIAVFPNSSLIDHKVVNHTMLDTLRVVVPFSIAYKEFPQHAREIVLAIAQNDSRLVPENPPSVVVTAMSDSSIDLALRVWIRDPKEEIDVFADYSEKIREALRSAGIEIPFPHLQLSIDEAKAFEKAPFMRGPNPQA